MTLNIDDWPRTHKIEDLRKITPERFLYQIADRGGNERVEWLENCGSEYQIHLTVERMFLDPVIRCRAILETDEETAVLYSLTFGHKCVTL